MRATEIIRGVLDLIDQIECENQSVNDENFVMAVTSEEDPAITGLDTNRFKQIFDILSAERLQQYNNSPAEVIAGIESVTTNAGGGWNGPKHPADLKSNSISLFPNYHVTKD